MPVPKVRALECSHSPVWAGTRVKCLVSGVEENLLLPLPEPRATVNQQPPVHHEGWMISGQETVFCWVSVP
jgi:hypothetical protein